MDLRYKRNFIRHVIVPEAFEVNPGLYKTIKKKIKNEFNNMGM
jgi:tRNA(Ile)-lysidine synthase TilS/MesJ